MFKSKAKEPQYSHYKSIEFLPMWSYYQITDNESHDLRYLLKLEDYETLPDVNVDHLQETWDEIEYQVADIAIKHNRKSEILFDERKRYSLLQNKHFEIQNIIFELNSDKRNKREKNTEHLERLAKLGFALNPKKDYAKELVRVYKKSQGLLTKMGTIKGNIDSMTPEAGGKQVDIMAVINSIEKARPNLSIDPHTWTMKKWLLTYYEFEKEVTKKSMSHGR